MESPRPTKAPRTSDSKDPKGSTVKEFIKTPSIKILAGPEKVPIYVHKALARSRCEYFERVYRNGQFKEAKTDIFEFDEEDPVVIEAFVRWSYTDELDLCMCEAQHSLSFQRIQNLPPPKPDIPITNKYETLSGNCHVLANCWNKHIETCIKLWVFGDKRGAAACQNQVIMKLHELLNKFEKPTIWEATITWAWQNTSETSKLRKFFGAAYGIALNMRMTPATTSLPLELLLLALKAAKYDLKTMNLTNDAWSTRWSSLDLKEYYVEETAK